MPFISLVCVHRVYVNEVSEMFEDLIVTVVNKFAAVVDILLQSLLKIRKLITI